MFSKKLFLFFFSFLIMTAFACAQNDAMTKGKVAITRGEHAWMSIATTRPETFREPRMSDTGLVRIFSNLAVKYPNGEYWCCTGYNVMGPNSGVGEQWMAAAFTPKANHTVTEIDVGVGYSQQGTNGVVVSLNLDNSGKPGKSLKSWSVLGLPRFGDCCEVVSVGDSAGIPVNGGQQYWIVLKTNSNELDTVDGWNVDDTDQINMATLASFTGNGWVVFQATPGVAFAVKGSN